MWKNKKIALYYHLYLASHATPWCNGSTSGFGPFRLGSSPGGVANFFVFSTDLYFYQRKVHP